MQRYFIDTEIRINENSYLHTDDIHHIQKVMRNKIGDFIICIDTKGINYQCEIIKLDTGMIRPVKIVSNNSELDVQVTLIYALPKGDKFEWVLQKATELGVSTIVPLISKRCVVKTNKEKFSKKKLRYQKILKEASEQSYRNKIPSLDDVITMKEVEKYLGDYTIVAYEEDAKVGEHRVFSKVINTLHAGDRITIIVGSEGGFEEVEIDYFNHLGIQSCSLGNRILRSETAPLYMLSVIGYIRELGG